MYSEEYIRDLKMSANLNRKQEQEIMICPVCGRKIDKWLWRTTCCGAEIVWEEKKEGVDNGKGKPPKVNMYDAELMLEKLVEQAQNDNAIKKPISWALYQTWKWADATEEERKAESEDKE